MGSVNSLSNKYFWQVNTLKKINIKEYMEEKQNNFDRMFLVNKPFLNSKLESTDLLYDAI